MFAVHVYKKKLGALLLATLLAACASGPQVAPQDPARLAASHGFVQAVVPASWSGAETTLTLKSTAGGERFALVPAGAGLQRYALWLPAGEYEIEEMRGKQPSALPPIRVEAGRATDLGGIRWFDLGGYERVLVPFVHPEISAELEVGIAQNRAYLNGAAPIAWRPAVLPEAQQIAQPDTGLGLIVDLMMAYERSVNRPSIKKQLKEARSPEAFLPLARTAAVPTLNELAGSAEGDLYLGADFGQIRQRRPSGEWSVIDTATTLPVTAVYSAGPLLLAGTWHGQIRMRRSPDAGWEVTKALPNDEMVIDIDRAGARWLVLAARIKPAPFPGLVDVDGLKVYSGVRDDASDLALLKTVDLQHRTLPQGLGTRGQVWAGAYYLNAVTALERLDPATLQWQPLQPGHPVSHFRVAEPSGLLTAFLAQGMFSKLSVSADAGKTWRRMETPPYTVDDVQVLDPQTAQATRWSAGAFTANIEFLRYDLAGQTWPRILEAAPEACRRTFKTQDGAAVFCLSRGGSILRFDGKGLVVEFAAD